MNKSIIYILLFTFLLSSCDKAIFEDENKSKDPIKNFNYIWDQCNRKYSFFEYKNIDWDSIKNIYQQYLYEDMPETELFNLISDMLNELRDDHTNLKSDFNVSRFGNYKQGPDNFDWRIIKDNYLSDKYYSTGPFDHDFIKGDSIGYIRLHSFPGNIDNNNLDFVLNRYENTEGLIIDIRENGGGSISDIFKLLSRFISGEKTIYYSRIKNGPAHDDFSELKPVRIQAGKGEKYYKPVVLLIDRGSYSASSFTALSAREIDNFTLIGDTTGGGLGVPNGGEMPNGWTYRFSVTQTLDPEGNNYESGVPPHITSFVNWKDRTKDEVIERAVREIMGI